MAAVLDALAPYVKKMITDMVEEEVSMLLGVSGEIKKLDAHMEGMKSFLRDAERKRITDDRVQTLVRKLKDAMYDATDILEVCQLEASKQNEGGGCWWSASAEKKAPSCFQPLLFCLRNPVFANDIGSRIKELNQRLQGIREEAAKYSFVDLGSYHERKTPSGTTSAHLSSHKMTSEIVESDIVGDKIERDTKELAQELIKYDNDGKQQQIKVVSIVGADGMGKTTLAQKVFNETTIQEHFGVKIWLSITEDFDEAQLLRTAIKHAGGNLDGNEDKTVLTTVLTNTLSAAKFLLVMDDVWTAEPWNDVLSVPILKASQKHPGSRVLVTTTLEDLAQRMRVSYHQHHVTPLDDEDAWSLLKKQLTPNQVAGIDRLKNIGMEILKKCDGLPLAIKVVGGLLSIREDPSEREWKDVLDRPAWSESGQLPKELDSRLYLSYEDLSPQLKQCFLYCSLFPRGEVIIFLVICQMWISEGFIQPPPDGRSTPAELENIATKYYRELIKRNLIEPTPEFALTGLRCTMHDVVRSFAKYMAREESLVVVDDKQASTSIGGELGLPVRRLSVAKGVSVVEWAALQNQKSLRTLIINSRVNLKPGDSLASFSSLRVLYIWNADCNSLVASLVKLKHLRYLHLEATDISSLPDDIHKMKFLLSIMVGSSKKLGHLPSSIVNLVDLRSLHLNGCNLSAVPKGFHGLTNLTTLSGFPVHVDGDVVGAGSRWCSLQELAPLTQLRYLSLVGVEKVPSSSMAEEAKISSKGHLIGLEFRYSTGGGGVEQQQQQSVIQEEVLEKLCPPTCIENLRILGGYLGRKLPDWIHAPASAAAFASLKSVMLVNLPCCTQLPDGLCYLPCLEMVTMENVTAVRRIGPEFQAFSSSSSAAAAAAEAAASVPFPKLKELYLDGLRDWEEWEWNAGCDEQGGMQAAIAMPCLEKLKIANCKLSRLPPGLANSNRHALRELYLYDLTNLISVENFPCVVQLDVFNCHELKRISSLPRLHRIRILCCSKLEAMEDVPTLDTMVLKDGTMETLPGYLQHVSPRYLQLACSKKLFDSLPPGSSARNEIGHIRKLYREVDLSATS